MEESSADYLYKFSKMNTTLTEFDDKLVEVHRKLD
jgi:hypothetical protein